MKQVLCTCGRWYAATATEYSPRCGEIYTVKSVSVYRGKIYYELEGFPTNLVFYTGGFLDIATSNIDERDIAAARNLPAVMVDHYRVRMAEARTAQEFNYCSDRYRRYYQLINE